MLDSIFIVIHHFNEPYKKKDLHYLLSSRLDSSKKENLVISYDININNKCPDCREFNPWILVKNCGEGLFLLKKFIEKYGPWLTASIQENLYELKYKENENFDNIFLLITRINSFKNLYELIRKDPEIIIDQDLRLKNQCDKCEIIYPWLILKNNKEGFELARQLYENFKPFIILKKQKIIYDHNIPKIIKEQERWTWREEMRYGNLKIEI